jgi:GH18 family chitinase
MNLKFAVLIYDFVGFEFPNAVAMNTALFSDGTQCRNTEKERQRERSVLFINSLKCYCRVVAQYNRSNERCSNGKEGESRNSSPTAIL